MTFQANKPQLIVSGVTATFSSLGIGTTQVSIIREEPQLAGGTFKSFNPLSSINSLTGLTSGRGYLIYPKTAFTVLSQIEQELVYVNTYDEMIDVPSPDSGSIVINVLHDYENSSGDSLDYRKFSNGDITLVGQKIN